MDSDDSGYITVENLRGILGNEFPEDELNTMVDGCDQNSDHRISYDEFLALFQQPSKNDDELLQGENIIESSRSVVSGESLGSEERLAQEHFREMGNLPVITGGDASANGPPYMAPNEV